MTKPLTPTPPQRDPARRRLLAMAVMLAVALGAVLVTQARAQPGETRPGPGTPPDQTGTEPAVPAVPAEQPPDQPQPADDAPAESNKPIDLSEEPLYRVGQLFMFSPIINGIIAGLSVLAVLFFLFFMASINRRTFAPPRFVDEVVKLVIRGDYDRAGDVCRRSRGVFAASIVQRCVENHNQNHSVMLDMIDTEGRRQADIVWNRVSYLADISNVAPMLGLLGTVLGMIKAFYGLEHESGGIDAVTLSRGVGEAMSTTLFGLTVGIFTLVLYSLVKSRATRTLADAEQAVHMIADHLKRDDSAIPSGR